MTSLPDALLVFADQAVFWLLTYLLHSTVLIVGAWVVTRFAPLEPGARDFVWRVALLAGVVTASGAALSAAEGPEVNAVGRVAIRREVRVVEGIASEARLSDADAARGAGAEAERGPLHWAMDPSRIDRAGSSGSFTPSAECRALLRRGPTPGSEWIGRVDELCTSSAGLDWRSLLVLFWLLGAGWALVGLRRGYDAVRELTRNLTPASRRTREALAELGTAAGSVRVKASAHLSAPCALPGSTIGLPPRCEEELSREELGAVLAHELAHVVRRDVAWSGFLHAIVAIFWLQPLNRLALRSALEATEEACDDWALSRTGARVGLAMSISRVAAWASTSFRDPVSVSMAGRNGGAVAARVRRILFARCRPERRWRRIMAAVAIAVPLPLLPPLPAPARLHTAVWVDERDIAPPFPAPGSVGTDSVRERIIVARFHGD